MADRTAMGFKPRACTGVAAVWCPNCGGCTCPNPDDLNDPACPLHSVRSAHAAVSRP